jgi:hypothetical protein
MKDQLTAGCHMNDLEEEYQENNTEQELQRLAYQLGESMVTQELGSLIELRRKTELQNFNSPKGT